ncbi:MAG: hypothetical protein Q8J76_15230, partial [Desulfobulbaceae bacterium]|nr:hypothetical protein [Desulfobulbaceae bacterium]
MNCHNPHYQEQLNFAPADPDAYLVTGTIATVVPDYVNNTSTITYSVNTPNPKWPADGALPTDPDWANKSMINPDRGLILVHDKDIKSNTFNIVSATNSQVVVRGILDPVETSTSTCVNTATCNTFGLVYGQLIKDNIVGAEVKFFDPYGGYVGDGTSNGICQVCHTQAKHYTNSAELPSGSDTHVGRDHINCITCHNHEVGFMGETHDNGSFGWAGNCATCHNSTGSVVSILKDENIHNGSCGLCHVDAVVGGARKDGDPLNGIDGSALGATNTSTCVDCHITKLVLTSGSIHHVSKMGYAAAGDCTECHADAVGKLAANHSIAVSTALSCGGCHTATAGTANGIPVDPANNKVHDACTTCHGINGALLSVAAANDPATAASVIAMGAGDCVYCHGAVSHTTYTHAANVTTSNTCDGCHTATAGTAIGMPVAPANNKVHDACTTCHGSNGALLSVSAANDPGTLATVIAMGSGNCVSCHGSVNHTTYTHATTVIASNTCDGCHAVTAGSASGMPIDLVSNKVHDACTTCHASNGALLSVSAANDPGTVASVIAMEAGNCVSCHGVVSHTSYSHATKVTASTECTGCHTATAGTASGMPINSTDSKVHDACTTCHATNGTLLTVSAANDPATAATVIAMAAGNCIGCHGNVSHGNISHETKVAATNSCNGCHNVTAGTVNGMPVDPADSKVHDACTTCHAANGVLLTLAAANDPATAATVIA